MISRSELGENNVGKRGGFCSRSTRSTGKPKITIKIPTAKDCTRDQWWHKADLANLCWKAAQLLAPSKWSVDHMTRIANVLAWVVHHPLMWWKQTLCLIQHKPPWYVNWWTTIERLAIAVHHQWSWYSGWSIVSAWRRQIGVLLWCRNFLSRGAKEFWVVGRSNI